MNLLQHEYPLTKKEAAGRLFPKADGIRRPPRSNHPVTFSSSRRPAAAAATLFLLFTGCKEADAPVDHGSPKSRQVADRTVSLPDQEHLEPALPCAELILWGQTDKEGISVRPLKIDKSTWQVHRIKLPKLSVVREACEKVTNGTQITGAQAMMRIDARSPDLIAFYQGYAEALGYEWSESWCEDCRTSISVGIYPAYRKSRDIIWTHGEPFVEVRKAADGSFTIRYHQ